MNKLSSASDHIKPLNDGSCDQLFLVILRVFFFALNSTMDLSRIGVKLPITNDIHGGDGLRVGKRHVRA